ncbi:MAG: dipeptide ABC transporter ATP-binding protein [bacterium]
MPADRIVPRAHPEGARDVVLSVRNLSVSFRTLPGTVRAVRGVSYDLHRGEILGIVGETGSGKSVSCRALTRLLPDNARIEGEVLYDGVDLLAIAKRDLPAHRGREISMVFQDPLSCLNPIRTIQTHMDEVLPWAQAPDSRRSRAADALRDLHIQDPESRLSSYPFEFSGGMAQRLQIAMALAKRPRVLVADEPTTALDVTIQARILGELRRLVDERDLAVILVTHDIGVIAETCDRVAVMYHGRIVESGPTDQIITSPSHPYTSALLSSMPLIASDHRRLIPIRGEGLPASVELPGCDFADRCPHASDTCRAHKPPVVRGESREFECHHPIRNAFAAEWERAVPLPDVRDHKPIVSVRSLSYVFTIREPNGAKSRLAAVNDVSLDIYPGEIVGVVGESGSGKSTLAKALMGIMPPTSGTISFEGRPLHGTGWRFKDYARRVQYVFQDPQGALDPRMNILRQCMEPLRIHRIGARAEHRLRAESMLRACGLDSSLFHRKPLGLSGGQRQRAVLARALIMDPHVLICDEPVSAMDVSVQAQVLNLIRDLAVSRDVTVVFISHDLSVVRNMCNRVLVMFRGSIVEEGPIGQIFSDPQHEYTQELIGSIPKVSFASAQPEAQRA